MEEIVIKKLELNKVLASVASFAALEQTKRQIASLAGICVGVKLAQVFSLNAVDEIVHYCACMVPDMDDDEDEEYEETEE